MTNSRYFEDLSVNEKFETGRRTITETDLVFFVNFMRMNNPLFTDQEYAERSIFRGRVVPGGLVFTVAMGLLDNLGLFLDTLFALLNLEMKFVLPVKVGDTLQVESVIEEKHESTKPDRGVITLKETVLNQEKKGVLELKRKILLKRRPRL